MSDNSQLKMEAALDSASAATIEKNSDQALGHFLVDSQLLARDGDHLAGPDEDFSAPFDLPPSYDNMQLRSEGIAQRLAKVVAAENPLLEAAQPLLRALSEMPAVLDENYHAISLKQALKNEITLFSVVCDEADISWKKMAIVRYCICTALDEAAHATPWGVQTGWSQSNLLNHFEGDNDGGDKFFLLVGRLSMTPNEYLDVLEILLRILGLGFEGRYSIVENGDRQLTKIRQRLLTLLQTSRDALPQELSSQALPVRTDRKRHNYFIPLRVSLLLAGTLIAGSWIYYKYFLVVPESALLNRLGSLARLPKTFVPAPQALRLRILLKNEIAQKLLSVVEDAGHGIVTFNGNIMFNTGGTDIREEVLPVLQRIAQEVKRVKGRVRIVGYTDSMPINRPGIPNNQVLSEKRASSVAALLEEMGIASNNLRSEGAGDRKPIASNTTAEGRAKNRRVDIVVDY